ncbi:MAG: reverse transcriptase domain-containing protein [Planctomycetota bacterium]|nr:reverse transcriptase domain-containing protein [Planctomycetota bacterium]
MKESMAERRDGRRLRWQDLYSEAELYKAAVRLYTRPLFDWRKALSTSTDGRTLYDFARQGLRNLHRLHRSLQRRRFRFRPALALERNFNGKQRTLYIHPWEERLVSLLLYRLLNRALDGSFSDSAYAYRLHGFGVNRCQGEIIRTLRGASGPLHVMKRDIADFFASVDHDVLLGKLTEIVDPDDYLFELLRDGVRFRFLDDNGDERTAARGIPFGTAVACLFANIYLMELDRRLEAVPGLRFFRYADDLLALAPSRAVLDEARENFRSEMAALRLTSKASHARDFLLSAGEAPEGGPPACSRFRHLGLEFRADGSVGLSRDKFRKIRNLFRYAFRRRRGKFRRIRDPEKRAALAARIARRTVSEGMRNVAIIDYYLRHVTDEEQLRRLDRWLAEEVLSLAFQSGHKKGNFRSMSFRRLREMGLPSLVHRRRLILHGQIDSPFFVWKTYQAQRGYGGTVARSRSPEASSFSQSPEAVAGESS